jgi:hypothetical protein
MSLSPPWKLRIEGDIPFKSISILTGKQHARCWSS